MAQNTPPTGITGNTSAQMNSNAAPSATAQRQSGMKAVIERGPHVGFAVGFIIVGLILANTEMNFAWKLLTAGALIFGGKKLADMKFAFLKPWGGIIRFSGWIVLVTVLLSSGFGQITINTVNKAERQLQQAASGETVGCPQNETVTETERPIIYLQDGCTQELRVTVEWEPMFRLDDSRFPLVINEYVEIKWDARNPTLMRLTPRTGKLPAGERLPVSVLDPIQYGVMPEEDVQAILDAAKAASKAADDVLKQ